MPDTESDHHRDDAAVARLDLVAPPAAPATDTTACCDDDEEEEEDGFTFAAAAAAVAVPVLQDADFDCAFPDGRIGSPVYPVFGRPRRSLSLPKQQQEQDGDDEEEVSAAAGTVATARRRVPLGRLLLEERQDAATELDGVPAETYCLWSPGVSPPPSAGSSPARCRNSGFAGSTAFLRCKQDLVELVASVVTCRRNCYLF